MELVDFCGNFLFADYLRLELGGLEDYLALVDYAPLWYKERFGLRHRRHAGRTTCAGGLRVSRHGGIPSEVEARKTAQYILGQIISFTKKSRMLSHLCFDRKAVWHAQSAC